MQRIGYMKSDFQVVRNQNQHNNGFLGKFEQGLLYSVFAKNLTKNEEKPCTTCLKLPISQLCFQNPKPKYSTKSLLHTIINNYSAIIVLLLHSYCTIIELLLNYYCTTYY